MSCKNIDIRETAKDRGVFLYEIAERLGLTDGNFSRKLRKEFTQKEKTRIFAIIDTIAAEKRAAEAGK
ncbi:MAG: hypothetical protein IJJ15_08800 [Ruminococcus sp.]|nr:hypothetical protein [Ruminococcus sp.]